MVHCVHISLVFLLCFLIFLYRYSVSESMGGGTLGQGLFVVEVTEFLSVSRIVLKYNVVIFLSLSVLFPTIAGLDIQREVD